jgi:hypothetical protein
MEEKYIWMNFKSVRLQHFDRTQNRESY